MGDVILRWDGLDELRDALRQLPDHLTDESIDIVQEHVGAAGAAIIDEYNDHRVSGNLAKGVRIETSKSKGGISARLTSNAFHAWLFENGTEARHTAIGADRGSGPPHHVFVPIVVRERRAMYDELIAMVEREGLTVSGV